MICKCLILVANGGISTSTVGISLCKFRVDLDCSVMIRKCLLIVANGRVSIPSVGINLSAFRLDLYCSL